MTDRQGTRGEALAAIFVYGTLKAGELNAPLLDPYRRATVAATARGVLHDLGLYPALAPGDGVVRGELVRVAPAEVAALLALLDRLEGYDAGDEAGSVYVRRAVEVETADGGREVAWAYFYNRDPRTLPLAAGGVWSGRPGAAALAPDTEHAAFNEHVRAFLAAECPRRDGDPS
ncbi:MAG TPA: gamma-glutamylcyclotransferase family protein [Thermomicrobiales bacterium]|nr:gamma-glutamylcyclotransferase family protein [Thermomicrobiales bacterium]